MTVLNCWMLLRGLLHNVDGLVSNPGIPADGNNIINSIPLPKIKPHVCNQQYQGINNLEMDLVDLVATCQRHTRCSTSYCLKRKRGKQECRFGYPKPLQQVTTITTQEGEPVVLTSRNDNLLNAYNPVQLSAWRANVDMQYIVSRNKVIKYVAKYATKSEPRSKGLQEVYSTIMKSIKEDATPLKVVQKLLTSTIGERDFSAQETCHLLLMLPLFRASRDFVVLSLDGSRQVTETFEEDKSVTVDSQLDHYCARPDVPEFREVSLLKFVQKYRIPKKIGSALVPRNKDVIVIPRPYCSPDPQGPQYEQYSKQKLMLHKPFVQLDELLGGCDTYAAAYATFLQSGNVPKSLADDIHRLEMAQAEDQQTVDEEVTNFQTIHFLFIYMYSFCRHVITMTMMIKTRTLYWIGCSSVIITQNLSKLLLLVKSTGLLLEKSMTTCRKCLPLLHSTNSIWSTLQMKLRLKHKI